MVTMTRQKQHPDTREDKVLSNQLGLTEDFYSTASLLKDFYSEAECVFFYSENPHRPYVCK